MVEGLSYLNAVGYLELQLTDHEFQARAAGTDQAVASVPLDAEPGAIYTVFALGLLEPDAHSQVFQVRPGEDVAPLTERARDSRSVGRGRRSDRGDH